MPDGVPAKLSLGGISGALRGLCLNGPTAYYGDPAIYERHLATGVSRENVEGSPAPPSLKLAHVQFWRFRWAVLTGLRTVSVQCKQAPNTTPYPKLVIRANPDVGLLADVVSSAGAGSGWKSISGSFNASADGVVWVELHNANTGWNPEGTFNCYFDHVVTT